jgi:hypothetical protein
MVSLVPEMPKEPPQPEVNPQLPSARYLWHRPCIYRQAHHPRYISHHAILQVFA